MIIGCGTGRNGSKSLAELLDIPHEMRPLLTWKIHENLYKEKVEQLKKTGGDVAMSYLNYLPMLIDEHDAKVVCLQRNRQETIDSFMHKTARRNPFMEHSGYRWEDSEFDKVFPSMEAVTKMEAIGKYWDLYYERATNLIKSYPYNLAIFDIDALNSKEGQAEIFDFCEIPEGKRNYQVGIKLNKS